MCCNFIEALELVYFDALHCRNVPFSDETSESCCTVYNISSGVVSSQWNAVNSCGGWLLCT